MASNINILDPITGIDQPVQVIRDNFIVAKLEIDELQSTRFKNTGDTMFGVLQLASVATASLPDPALTPGGIIFITDASPNPVQAYSDGTAWIGVDVGATGDPDQNLFETVTADVGTTTADTTTDTLNILGGIGISTAISGDTLAINREFQGALILMSVPQTIANSTATELIWASVEYDVGGFWSGGAPAKLTVPAGVSRVRVSANIDWVSSNAGTTRILEIRKNNAFFNGMGHSQGVPSGSSTKNASTAVIDATPGDQFSVFVFQDTGSNLNIDASQLTWISIEVIS